MVTNFFSYFLIDWDENFWIFFILLEVFGVLYLKFKIMYEYIKQFVNVFYYNSEF